MKNVGIFYGSTTGTAEGIAQIIAGKLGVSSDHVHDVAQISEDLVQQYEVLILGSSTWGDGELQDDWYDGTKLLAGMDLSGKSVAIYGCGDADSYSDTFCDAIGIIYNDIKATGCNLCGRFPTTGYTFDNSVALVDGEFVGLPLDEVNEDDLTEGRIDAWLDILKAECLN